uniref:Uncharacterized protein TCIL3000_11_12980 n=1 Tax=Trypanosoma congolense (strain IL3000) TaxID=1068625 RepID=G0V2C8_TRYCI|nr:unnamed protein product [Trypanosoma congolense IL3000]
MPYPYVLQCRESCNRSIGIKHDVATTVEGEITRNYAASAPCSIKDIFTAACDGDAPALGMYLEMGVDIDSLGRPNKPYGTTFNRCSNFCATPLCFAAAYGREKAVEFLLANGANPSKPSSTGIRPFEYARHRRYGTIMELLQQAERKQAHCAG